MIGIGLAAERTVPIIAGMIAVMVRATIRAGEELTAQGRGAATQEAFKHLALPPRHGRAKASEIRRPVAD